MNRIKRILLFLFIFILSMLLLTLYRSHFYSFLYEEIQHSSPKGDLILQKIDKTQPMTVSINSMRSGLSSLDIKIHTFDRVNNAVIQLDLKNSQTGKTIYSEEVDTRVLKDHDPYSIHFKRQAHSRQQTYLLTVTYLYSPHAHDDIGLYFDSDNPSDLYFNAIYKDTFYKNVIKTAKLYPGQAFILWCLALLLSLHQYLFRSLKRVGNNPFLIYISASALLFVLLLGTLFSLESKDDFQKIIPRDSDQKFKAAPITRYQPLKVEVIPVQEGLTGIGLKFGTYHRINNDILGMTLKEVDTDKIVAVGRVETASLSDNSFYHFMFPRMTSSNQHYQLEITSLKSNFPKDGIAVYGDSNGPYYEGLYIDSISGRLNVLLEQLPLVVGKYIAVFVVLQITVIFLYFYRKIFFSSLIYLYLLLLLTFTLTGYLNINGDYTNENIFAYPLLELVFFVFIYLLLSSCKKYYCTIVARMLLIVFGIIFIAQVYSIYVASNYIPPIAFSNTNSSQFISYTLIAIIYLVFGMSYLVHLASHRITNKSPKKLVLLSAAFPLGFIYIYQCYYHSPDFRSVGLIVEKQAPIASFVNAYKEYRQSSNAVSSMAGKEMGHNPFLKTMVYEKNVDHYGRKDQPNVIVFFVEGASSYLFGNHNPEMINLTKNLSEFAQNEHVMHVNNYYNHTAATFRGIRGQLMSGYQLLDGTDWDKEENVTRLKQNDTPSVVRILKDNNYSTYFFSGHTHKNGLLKMISSMHFDKVYGSEDLASKIDNPAQYDLKLSENYMTLSDEGLVKSLISELDELKKAPNPFFISIYNVGTHVFLDSVTHKYGDGSNKSLNRFYEFDQAFKEFITYFFESGLHKNTILIVTADHAAYPGPEYKKVNPTSRYLVDTIPLLIYSENQPLPKEIDAKGRNSIDFAPTLLNILGINDVENMFLGTSLFEKSAREMFSYISEIGINQYYWIKTGGIDNNIKVEVINKHADVKFKSAIETISHYHQFESP